ncbi:AMP-binding protein [Variovorax sp. GT1P44]|uniref:AMP-binding protein n=1 Tax=Variovorax sp. GT1P44 TaxID=3443742 RepID=UPI003F455D52
MTESSPDRAADAPLAVFDEPAVLVEQDHAGAVLLRSPRVLEPHPPFILHWLAHWAAIHPDQTLLAQRTEDGAWRRISYAEALGTVRRLAGALVKAGAGPHRPLAILSENAIEHALMAWAAHWANVPLAPISPAYALAPGALERLRAVLGIVEPWIVFAQDGTAYARALQAAGLPADRTIVATGAGSGASTFADFVDTCAPDEAIIEPLGTPDAVAKYMFTSGSTGVPKAVVMTHRMLAAAQQVNAQIVVHRPAQTMVQVDWLPWHHVMGGNVVLGRLLRFGGTLYIDDGRPLPGRFAQTLANLREVAPTYYFNVPAGYAMLVDEMERDPAFAAHMLGRLEFAYFAGAMLPRDTHERFQRVAERTLGRRIVIGTAYAATETTSAVLMRTWEATDTACIGVPLPGCEVKLVPDPTQPGRFELRARAPHVSGRYLGGAVQRQDTHDEDGFYRLGDAVRFVDPDRPEAGLLFGGRFAEDFKLGNGTWVRTGALRQSLLAACAPLLREAVIVGEGRADVAALAWLDASACRAFAKAPAQVGDADLVADPAIRARLADALRAFNATSTASSRRVERILLQTEAPSLNAYELTDKGSVNQRAVTLRRSAAVDALYLVPSPPDVIGAHADLRNDATKE